jgi:hypothetical protein
LISIFVSLVFVDSEVSSEPESSSLGSGFFFDFLDFLDFLDLFDFLEDSGSFLGLSSLSSLLLSASSSDFSESVFFFSRETGSFSFYLSSLSLRESVLSLMSLISFS